MPNRYFSPLLGFLPKTVVNQIQAYFEKHKEVIGKNITFSNFKFTNFHKAYDVGSNIDVQIINTLQTGLHNQTTYFKDQSLAITNAKGCSTAGVYLAFANICDGVQLITKDEDETFKTNELAIYIDNLKVSEEELAKTLDSIAWPNMITRDGALSVSYSDIMNYGKTYLYNNLPATSYKNLAIYLNIIYQKDKPKYDRAKIEAFINEKMLTIKIGQHLHQDNFFDASEFEHVAKFQMTSTDDDHSTPVTGTHFQQVGQRWATPTITITENMETPQDAYSLAVKQGRTHTSFKKEKETVVKKEQDSILSNVASKKVAEFEIKPVLIFKIGKFYLFKFEKTVAK